MRFPKSPVCGQVLVCLLLVLPALATAGVTVEFTGTVTSIIGDEDFFDVPDAGVGSSLTGIITYEPFPDFIHDPYPGDCEKAYLFYDGLMTISILHYVWEYNSLAIQLNDCETNDQVQFMGQGALSYPESAPAHQLILNAFDQVQPYDMVQGLDVPTGSGQLDLTQATRLTGRIYSFGYGEVRFDVDSIRMTGTVPVEPTSWDGLKALFR